MTDPTTTPDTAETIAHLRAVLNLLDPTIAHLESLIAKAWCFQPGERVLVVRNPLPNHEQSLCGQVVTLIKPVQGQVASVVYWSIKEYPYCPVPEAALRPLRAKV